MFSAGIFSGLILFLAIQVVGKRYGYNISMLRRLVSFVDKHKWLPLRESNPQKVSSEADERREAALLDCFLDPCWQRHRDEQIKKKWLYNNTHFIVIYIYNLMCATKFFDYRR
mgnify:CR=1 FL=1